MEDWQYVGLTASIFLAASIPERLKVVLLILGTVLFALSLYELHLIGKF